MRVATVAPSDPTARGLRVWRGGPFRERRGLSFPGALCRFQCARQALDFAAQPIAFTLQPSILFTQPLGVALDSLAIPTEPIALATQSIHFALKVVCR